MSTTPSPSNPAPTTTSFSPPSLPTTTMLTALYHHHHDAYEYDDENSRTFRYYMLALPNLFSNDPKRNYRAWLKVFEEVQQQYQENRQALALHAPHLLSKLPSQCILLPSTVPLTAASNDSMPLPPSPSSCTSSVVASPSHQTPHTDAKTDTHTTRPPQRALALHYPSYTSRSDTVKMRDFPQTRFLHGKIIPWVVVNRRFRGGGPGRKEPQGQNEGELVEGMHIAFQHTNMLLYQAIETVLREEQRQQQQQQRPPVSELSILQREASQQLQKHYACALGSQTLEIHRLRRLVEETEIEERSRRRKQAAKKKMKQGMDGVSMSVNLSTAAAGGGAGGGGEKQLLQERGGKEKNEYGHLAAADLKDNRLFQMTSEEEKMGKSGSKKKSRDLAQDDDGATTNTPNPTHAQLLKRVAELEAEIKDKEAKDKERDNLLNELNDGLEDAKERLNAYDEAFAWLLKEGKGKVVAGGGAGGGGVGMRLLK